MMNAISLLWTSAVAVMLIWAIHRAAQDIRYGRGATHRQSCLAATYQVLLRGSVGDLALAVALYFDILAPIAGVLPLFVLPMLWGIALWLLLRAYRNAKISRMPFIMAVFASTWVVIYLAVRPRAGLLEPTVGPMMGLLFLLFGWGVWAVFSKYEDA